MNQVDHMATGRRLSALLLLACLFLGLLCPTATLRAELPPRPGATQRPEQKEPTPDIIEGEIVLTIDAADPAPAELWTVVQWQGGSGTWYDVEGWRSAVTNGRITWWVEEKDFGKGPYRWLVYASEGSELLATSQSFNLPDRTKLSIEVAVSLGE